MLKTSIDIEVGPGLYKRYVPGDELPEDVLAKIKELPHAGEFLDDEQKPKKTK